MSNTIWPIVYLGFLFLAILFIGVAIYYAAHMFLEVSPKKRWLFNLFPYLLGVLPGLLTPAGRRAKNRFFLSLIVAAAFFGAALAVLHTYGSAK